jgi:membrane associated rhomboid family serine protease
MPLTEMVVMIAMLAAGVLLAIALLRLFSTLIKHRTIRQAVQSNPQLAESLVERFSAAPDESRDDRVAVVLLAIGVAMAVAPLIAVDDPGMIRLAIGAALFPLLVGTALWLRSRAAERAKRRERAE